MIRIKNVRLYTGETYFDDGAVLIDGADIVYAGDAALCPECEGAEVIDGKHAICMPGLANAHGHAAMVLLRGAGSDLALMDWLGKVVPLEGNLTPDIIYTGSVMAIMEMLRTGTTCYADMYYHMESAFRAAIDTGIRANLTRGSSDKTGVDSHPAWFRDFDGYDGRIRSFVGLHAEYTSDPETVRYAAEVAGKLGTGIQVHMSETQSEVDGCISRHGATPVEYFRQNGIFQSPVLAAHGAHLTDADVAIIRSHDVTIAHCPASNLKLASGIAPVSDYLAKGMKIALGTDGAASENALDMFREMWLASLLQKGTHLDATALPAKEAIRMATVTGAHGMGFDKVGILKEGWKADLILLDPDSLALFPGRDAVSDIVYAASGQDVKLTMVNGRVLYKDGEFTTIDREKAVFEAKAAAAKL